MQRFGPKPQYGKNSSDEEEGRTVTVKVVNAWIRLHNISPGIARLGRCRALGRLGVNHWASGATINCLISLSVS